MIIYPDIEIQNGQSVNRIRGKENAPELYDITPLDAALKFVDAGAEWLHVIDIDAGLDKGDSNTDLIGKIIDAVDIPVQVGGGLKTPTDVEWWLERGAARVVLGTIAVVDRMLTMDVCSHHPDKVVISITGKDGYAMIEGWRTRTSFLVRDVAKSFENSGAAAIIYTDLDRFEGGPEVGLATTIEIGTELDIPLISTGTIDTLDDVSTLALLPKIQGVIIGRALFSRTFELEQAIEVARSARIAPELANAGVAPRLDEVSGIPIKHTACVGIGVSNLKHSMKFYKTLGFVPEHSLKKGASELEMQHHSGVAIRLLHRKRRKPSPVQLSLAVESLAQTRSYLDYHDITASKSSKNGPPDSLSVEDPDGHLVVFQL